MHATPNDNLAQLLAQVPPGGTLTLAPGVYSVDTLRVQSRTIQGTAGQVQIRGRVVLADGASVVGVTIQGPGNGNAVICSQGAATVAQCQVVLPDGSEFPAIGVKNAQLSVVESTVRGGNQRKAILGVDNAQISVARSHIDRLDLESSSRGVVQASVVSTLFVTAGSQMQLREGVTIEAPTGKRLVIATNGATLQAERVVVRTGRPEMLVRDATLHMPQVSSENGEPVVVKAEGNATCDVDTRTCTVHREGGSAKDMRWRVADADFFDRAVAPQLAPQATVQMEEGEYTIDSVPEHMRELTLRGAGRDVTTIAIRGALNAKAGVKVRVEDATLLQSDGHNAVNAFEDGTVQLARTRVVAAQRAGKVPALYVRGGRMVLEETVVESPAAVAHPTLAAFGGEVLARGSFVGWAQALDGSAVVVDNSGAYSLRVEGSRVSGSLALHPSFANFRQLVVQRGGQCELNQLTIFAFYSEFLVDHARLSVGEARCVQGAQAAVYADGGEVDFGAAALFEKADGQWRKVREPQLGDATPPAVPAAPGESADATGSGEGAGAQPTPGDPMAQINELVGLETVKQQIAAFMDRVKFNQRRTELGLATEPVVMHSMFLGNPGTGKTTVARLLGQALFSAGAVRTNTFVEVGRADLVAEHIGGTAQKTNKVLEEARGGVLFIDEAYDLHSESGQDFGKEAVNAILTFMENNRDDIVIIFAGYTDMMQDFLSMNPGLKSRIPNRFDFEDYSADELAAIGAASLSKKGFTFDEEALLAAIRRQYRRSGDGSNGRWVRNFEDKLISAISSRLSQEHAGDLSQVTNDEITSVTSADIRAVTGGEASGKRVDELLDELEGLIGLEEVKQWATDLVQVAEANQRLEAQGLQTSTPTYHMVFSGNPGTGKTTVARIVAEIFHALGILESPTVKEVTRADLVGSVIGATEKQTTRALDEALGGVLFIDEAYQLTGAGGANDFGLQAVETLLPRLENDRGKFIAILAGYTNEMDEFMNANPGLRSRIPNSIEFPDYSSQDVARIVEASLQGRGWLIDAALLEATVTAVYDALPAHERGNGRWARNFADRLEHRHKLWIAQHNASGDQLRTITDDTVRAVGQEFTTAMP